MGGRKIKLVLIMLCRNGVKRIGFGLALTGISLGLGSSRNAQVSWARVHLQCGLQGEEDLKLSTMWMEPNMCSPNVQEHPADRCKL